MRVLSISTLRYNQKVIAPGAQTERRGDAGPVRVLLGGKPHRPPILSILTLSAFAAARTPLSTRQSHSSETDAEHNGRQGFGDRGERYLGKVNVVWTPQRHREVQRRAVVLHEQRIHVR